MLNSVVVTKILQNTVSLTFQQILKEFRRFQVISRNDSNFIQV